jgi:hypothetical protein
MNYKAETTLNERDTLTDIYLTLRLLIKAYANALSLSTSKGFIKQIKEHLNEVSKDRLDVFMLLTERDYMGVNSCDDERKKELINRFKSRIDTLN